MLTVSSVQMEYICDQNIVQVNRMNKNPSNSPRIMSTNISGPGNIASQPVGSK